MMREKSKYFRLNKQQDFQRGVASPELFWQDGLTLPPGSQGYYWSRVFDSHAKGTGWDKLQVKALLPVNTLCRLTVYSSEDSLLLHGGQRGEIAQWMAPSVSQEEQQAVFAPFLALETPLKPDLLLHGVQGRYLWFRLELASSQEEAPKIQEMRLSFGGTPWLDDLPELFRTGTDDFLKGYLYVFQSMYEEMEENITKTVSNYTASQAAPEFLEWLMGWYAIEEKNLFDTRQMRRLLSNAPQIYRRMGTRWAVETMVELYLGEKPVIVEYYQKDDPDFHCPYSVERKNLFVNPYVFTVLVPGRLVKSRGKYLSLLQLIDSCKPAHMMANVILVSQQSKQRQGNYLGQNTYLLDGAGDGWETEGMILRNAEGKGNDGE